MANEGERLAAFEAILTRVESKLDRMADKSQIPMWISVAVAVVMALYTMWPKK